MQKEKIIYIEYSGSSRGIKIMTTFPDGISLSWLQQTLPKMRIIMDESFKARGCWRCILEKLDGEEQSIAWQMLQRLLSEGWTLFYLQPSYYSGPDAYFVLKQIVTE